MILNALRKVLKEKKKPERTCCGCRQKFDKSVLLRVVRRPQGKAEADISGKAQGRGAYVCRDANCLKKAVKSGALERTLKTSIPDEVIKELEEEIEDKNAE